MICELLPKKRGNGGCCDSIPTLGCHRPFLEPLILLRPAHRMFQRCKITVSTKNDVHGLAEKCILWGRDS